MEFTIKYLPLAKKDIGEIVEYITETLEAPKVASNFINEIEKKIVNLKKNPYSHHLYRSSEPIDTEYRIINVKNYLVFYVVLNNVIEIHRVIYNKRNLSKIIKS
ncbi:MAG: type II toxin-antitoxin system RelE/ParE family toxin [Spirochaetales bacterium]|jgi:plasmid stabilization system protein ParE|nr:type II toxin-antitoxin system RelE/ParE family toxin [Spirochaetales bacterium]